MVDNSTLLRAIRSNRAYQTIRIPLRAVYLDEQGDPASATGFSTNSPTSFSPEDLSPEVEHVSPRAVGPVGVRNIGFVPDVDHRFFQEDVPFVLVVLRDIAEMIGVATPIIDEIILWAQSRSPSGSSTTSDRFAPHSPPCAHFLSLPVSHRAEHKCLTLASLRILSPSRIPSQSLWERNILSRAG